MRRIFTTLALASALAFPVLAAAGAPQEEAAMPCGHHAKADCGCTKASPQKAAKTDAEPSDFVRNVWTSP